MSFLFLLVSWLVQATAKSAIIVAVATAAYFAIGRRVSARWWCVMWLLVLLRVAIPIAPASSWSIFRLVPIHPGIDWQLRGPAAPMMFDAFRATLRVPWWIAQWKSIVAVWLFGFAIVTIRALIATARMQSLVFRALETGGASPEAWRIIEAARPQLGIRREVVVAESPLIDVPALHGVIRPTLLLPEGLCDSFGSAELRHVILHELAHLRRNDILVNWLLTAIRAIYWFNPFARFAIARAEEERELACDDLTLSCLAPTERIPYGRTILKLLERFRSPESAPALVGIVNQKHQMRRRLRIISGVSQRSRMVLPFVTMLSAVALMAFADAPGSGISSLSPNAMHTFARLNRPIDMNVSDVPLDELLHTVHVKTGVAVTQSDSINSPALQRARFTVHVANTPARAVLMNALLPYGIVPTPRANGVTLTTGPPCLLSRRRQTN